MAKIFFPPVSSIFLDIGREAVYRLSSSTATTLRSDGSKGGRCSFLCICSGGDRAVTAVGDGDEEADSTSTAGLPDLVEYHIAPPNTTVEAARPIVRLLSLIGGRDELGIDPFGTGDCIEG